MTIKARGNKAPPRAFILVALKGIIVEKKYFQSVVERAYSFVEDMFGLRNVALAELGPAITAQRPSSENAWWHDPYSLKTVVELFTELSKEVRPRQAVTYVKDLLDIPSDPEDTQLIPPTVREHDLSTDESLRLEDPHFYRFKKIVERSRRTSLDTEHEKRAADAHMDAAEKIDHAKELVGQALTEIEDISRGMRE
jgi:hypothetical protein